MVILVQLPAGSGLESPALKQAPGTEVIVLRPAATGMNASPPQRIAAQLVTSDVILPPQFMKREYSGGSMPSFTTPSQFSAVSGTSGMFSPYVHDMLPFCVNVCDVQTSIVYLSLLFVFIPYNTETQRVHRYVSTCMPCGWQSRVILWVWLTHTTYNAASLCILLHPYNGPTTFEHMRAYAIGIAIAKDHTIFLCPACRYSCTLSLMLYE